MTFKGSTIIRFYQCSKGNSGIFFPQVNQGSEIKGLNDGFAFHALFLYYFHQQIAKR